MEVNEIALDEHLAEQGTTPSSDPLKVVRDCEQCGEADVICEYVKAQKFWRCVVAFPCEIMPDMREKAEVVEKENEYNV
jgi:hypothetical protein